ncbi:MAG: hypothetical protein AAF378_10655 [Cyanobacteria bacterium P01_A01_bin.84]
MALSISGDILNNNLTALGCPMCVCFSTDELYYDNTDYWQWFDNFPAPITSFPFASLVGRVYQVGSVSFRFVEQGNEEHPTDIGLFIGMTQAELIDAFNNTLRPYVEQDYFFPIADANGLAVRVIFRSRCYADNHPKEVRYYDPSQLAWITYGFENIFELNRFSAGGVKKGYQARARLFLDGELCDEIAIDFLNMGLCQVESEVTGGERLPSRETCVPIDSILRNKFFSQFPDFAQAGFTNLEGVISTLTIRYDETWPTSSIEAVEETPVGGQRADYRFYDEPLAANPLNFSANPIATIPIINAKCVEPNENFAPNNLVSYSSQALVDGDITELKPLRVGENTSIVCSNFEEVLCFDSSSPDFQFAFANEYINGVLINQDFFTVTGNAFCYNVSNLLSSATEGDIATFELLYFDANIANVFTAYTQIYEIDSNNKCCCESRLVFRNCFNVFQSLRTTCEQNFGMSVRSSEIFSCDTCEQDGIFRDLSKSFQDSVTVQLGRIENTEENLNMLADFLSSNETYFYSEDFNGYKRVRLTSIPSVLYAGTSRFIQPRLNLLLGDFEESISSNR